MGSEMVARQAPGLADGLEPHQGLDRQPHQDLLNDDLRQLRILPWRTAPRRQHQPRTTLEQHSVWVARLEKFGEAPREEARLVAGQPDGEPCGRISLSRRMMFDER